MTCKNLIAICSKTHLPCPFVSTNGECKDAECTNAVVPTWAELLDIYKAAVHPTNARLRNVKASINTLVRALGTTIDAKVAVTDEQMDAAYSALLADHQPETIGSIFGAMKACTSQRREVKMEYRKRGKVAPEIDMPTVELRTKPVVQLTEAQRVAVREELTRLRHSPLRSDRTRFVWFWFLWNFGMRPIDVGKIKWSCLVTHSNGTTWLDYEPSKTARYGKRAGGRLTETQVEEIRPFIGAPDEYVIPRLENRRPKGGCVKVTHGESVAHHASLRRYVIDFMRSIGIDDPKPQYATRKDCSQRTIKARGLLHEAQMLGHNPRVSLRHYANLHSMELKEGL